MSVIRFSILAVLLTACSYNPDYGDGNVRCEPGGICPGNLVCATDNFCRAQPGDTIDAPDDDTDADDTDAPEVDITPPDTSLASMPSAISGPDVTFIIDSTEVNSTFKCAVDSTTLMPCNATQMFMTLSTGNHIFRAAAVDMAGNEDLSPVVFMWAVDPTVLDTTITAGPLGTSGPNPQFTFTSTRPGTFMCRLGPMEANFSVCTSPKSYTGLAEIAAPGYTFEVRAHDTGGNMDDTPARQTFLVDATGPTVTISAPTQNTTVGTSFTLMFSSEAGATHTCQLDNQAVINNCTSPRTFMSLTSVMPHTIRVTATDTFGNVGPATTHNFTVDDVGPSLSINGSPTNGMSVNTTSAALSFSIIPSSEPAPFTFECRFNSTGTFTTCTGFNQSMMTEGTQTLEVRARDRFGNAGGVVTHTWTITALTTTISAIRTTGIAQGTRVRISTNVRMTAKTNNRFWVQEADGATTPPPTNRGITILPVSPSANPLGDAMLVPGRGLTITGTVLTTNGNLTLSQAAYFPGGLLGAYNAKDTSRDSLVLLTEVNEGMYVNSAGRASGTAAPSCQNFDFCIVTCDRPMPVVDSIDAANTVMINEDHNFEGVLEGNGTGFVYFVTVAQEQNDACL